MFEQATGRQPTTTSAWKVERLGLQSASIARDRLDWRDSYPVQHSHRLPPPTPVRTSARLLPAHTIPNMSSSSTRTRRACVSDAPLAAPHARLSWRTCRACYPLRAAQHLWAGLRLLLQAQGSTPLRSRAGAVAGRLLESATGRGPLAGDCRKPSRPDVVPRVHTPWWSHTCKRIACAELACAQLLASRGTQKEELQSCIVRTDQGIFGEPIPGSAGCTVARSVAVAEHALTLNHLHLKNSTG